MREESVAIERFLMEDYVKSKRMRRIAPIYKYIALIAYGRGPSRRPSGGS